MNLLKRFPSYDIVIKGAVSTFRRYPLTILSAVVTSLAMAEAAGTEPFLEREFLWKLAMVAALGVPLFISMVHIAERMQWRRHFSVLAQVAGLLVLGVYYLTLPADVTGALIHPVRFALLFIGLHFLVAVGPHLAGNSNGVFWQYNKALFLRFLMAALYSAVMYVGLTIALAAADHLFGFDVKDQRYFQMWIIITGIFNSWIFLGGIPENLNDLDRSVEYPRGLKVFTQYILLPLVALYFIILITYEAKIIIEWNWPKGWVSHLVLWYSVVGILSSLLLHPLKEREGNIWIQTFSKWFYRALIPLVVLLFLAIMRRISEYGLTENRYFVLAMAIGLAVAVIYFVFSRKKDIRVIPGILCVVAFLSALGPWSAFALSEKAQKSRLEEFLVRNEILVDGILGSAQREVTFEDRKEISSIVDYLNEWHGLGPFAGWIPETTLTALDTVDQYSRASKITGLMGIEWVSAWETEETGNRFSLYRQPGNVISLAGFDYLVELDLSDCATDTAVFTVAGSAYLTSLERSQGLLSILLRTGTDDSSGGEVNIPLRPFIEKPRESSRGTNLPAEDMTLSGECESFEARLILRELSGYNRPDSLSINCLRAGMLLRLK